MTCTPTSSHNDFTGDGSTTSFTITFNYQNANDLRVRTGSAPPYGNIPTTGFAPANGNPQSIVFTTAPSGPFRIYRCTADANIDAVFQSGSAVRASDLNDNFEQLLYLAQEAKAGVAGSVIDIDNELDTKVDTVSATAPITGSISGTTLSIGITAASQSAAGSMSANDKTKLDSIIPGSKPGTVTSVSGVAPISVTDPSEEPVVSISAATASAAGSMSAADKAKLDSIQVSTTTNAVFSEPADSTRTEFTLSGNPDANSVWDFTISVNGVIQQPGVDYNYASGKIIFTSAPIVGSEMWVTIKGFRSATGDWRTNISSSLVPLTALPSGYGLSYGASQQELNDIIVSKIDLLENLTDALDARLDAIRVAVADSTDFDSLKTRLLAILQ